jgi:uncharacterized protein
MSVKIENKSPDELKAIGVFAWDIWEKEISEFDWFYESMEQCYFLEGEVTIQTSKGEFFIHAGDFVTFPLGLSCRWIVKKPVKKHYCFH